MLEFRKIIDIAGELLGKKGKSAMKLAKIANDAAKAKLGENSEIIERTNEAIRLLKLNFESYKKKANL